MLLWTVADLRPIDEGFLDDAQGWNVPDASNIPIAIVDVDDETTQSLSYPFSRALYAHLLDVLDRGGAKWVIFDIVFDTRRRNGDGIELFPGEDSAFAKALERHRNVTLAGQIPDAERISGSTRMRTLESLENIAPLPEFLASVPRWGAVQTKSENDGVVRRYVSAWPELGGNLRLSLASRAIVEMGLADSASLLGTLPWSDPSGFRIRFFGGNRTFPTYSLLTVLDDSTYETKSEEEWGEHLDLADSLLESGAFRDRIVLIGSSALLNQDVVRTAMSGSFPGVELHANALGTWILGQPDRDIPLWATWAILIAFSYLSLFWIRQIESWWLIALPSLLLGSVWIVAILALAGWGRWMGSVSIGAGMGFFSLLYGGLARYVGELGRKREITRTFGQYVSPEVVRIMTSDPSRVKMGGQRGEISVLFSDFQGFTALSEKLPPEQFVPQIGECFSVLSEEILLQRGTLDKYMGDAIMAEFGMPLPLEDKAARACHAAWRMQIELSRLREEWNAQGLPGLHMRVGIATGLALFGNMGSRQKFDYTALGDTVNLGSRLEGVNKVYGTGILIDGETRSQAGNTISARLLDRIRVSGKSQAVEVWELVHVLGDPAPALLPEAALVEWSRIREAWDREDFDQARRGAESFLLLQPGDKPATLLLGRLDDILRDGVPEDWDGSVSMSGK